MNIAFFDLDGTITRKDTFIEFIKFTRGNFFFVLGLFLMSPFIFLFLIKIYPNYKLKELFFSFYLKKFHKKELLSLGEDFCKQKMPDFVYPEALETIKKHQANGDKTVILSASSEIWLAYWCKQNRLDFIGTEFETVGENYTGKIKGKNCYGKEKQLIVEKIISENNYAITYGYGDSKSDLFFLRKMDKYYFGAINTILSKS